MLFLKKAKFLHAKILVSKKFFDFQENLSDNRKHFEIELDYKNPATFYFIRHWVK